jgi:hypothetical protein
MVRRRVEIGFGRSLGVGSILRETVVGSGEGEGWVDGSPFVSDGGGGFRRTQATLEEDVERPGAIVVASTPARSRIIISSSRRRSERWSWESALLAGLL